MCGLSGDVDVDDAAISSLEVRFIGRDQFASEAQAALFRAVVRAHGRDVFDRRGNICDGDGVQSGRAGRRGDHTDAGGRAGEIAGGNRHRSRAVVGDGYRADGGRAKEADPVKSLSRIIRELLGEGQELGIVVGLVARALGDVTVEHLEFANALEDFTRDFHGAILRLEERDGVTDVVRHGALPDGRSGQFHRNGETTGIIGRTDDFRTAGEPIKALLQHSVGGGEVVGSHIGCVVGIDYD